MWYEYDNVSITHQFSTLDYANGSYTDGQMDATKLNTILQDIVTHIPIYETRPVTTTTNINITEAEAELISLDSTKNVIKQ